MALRVSAVRPVGGYDERLGAGTAGAAGEDLEIIYRLLRSGAVLAFDPAVIVHHGRVTAQRRLATRRSYGFGMGAFVGMWFRTDRWVAAILARWMLIRFVNAARALKGRDPRRLREEALLVEGAIAGARHGWQLRSPMTFQPSQEPSPERTLSDGGVDSAEF